MRSTVVEQPGYDTTAIGPSDRTAHTPSSICTATLCASCSSTVTVSGTSTTAEAACGAPLNAAMNRPSERAPDATEIDGQPSRVDRRAGAHEQPESAGVPVRIDRDAEARRGFSGARKVLDALRHHAPALVAVHESDDRMSQHLGGTRRGDRERRRCGRILAAPDVVQSLYRGDGFRTGDAVDRQLYVRLELAHSPLGEGAEDAVGLAAGEPEHVERPLKQAHVRSVQKRILQVEEAVTQAEGRVDERSPGLVAHHAVLGELVLGLEAADSRERSAEEDAVDACRAKIEAETQETLLNVLDRGATIALSDGSNHTASDRYEPPYRGA